MEGRYRRYSVQTSPEKHAMFILALDDQSELHYIDTRKFGTCHLYPTDKLDEAPGLMKLGPEPLQKLLQAKTLQQQAHKKKVPIKAFLLDQRFISGIGNIYADEILFASQINPLRPAQEIKLNE
ncbi:unnamed protein product [Didymodactylos carnosus]|uniref:Formamidopyrimidine-DNA glycosylase catalytic domain-containing protein n=1 Tax=Didymodactylos carnosus TaxID=1234261 RepID=A0A8S2CMU4_9BILA|nr:unnamed protein product [Didymodactylos carnosus]CAF3491928.1 unnamed protein product [Didymodactylos carnosus]